MMYTKKVSEERIQFVGKDPAFCVILKGEDDYFWCKSMIVLLKEEEVVFPYRGGQCLYLKGIKKERIREVFYSQVVKGKLESEAIDIWDRTEDDRVPSTVTIRKTLPFRSYLIPEDLSEEWNKDVFRLPEVVEDDFPEAIHKFDVKWNKYIEKI